MWTKEVSIKSNASKEQIWKLWADVPNWYTWDDQVLSSSLNGDFKIGQTGELIPKGGPKSQFEIIEVSPKKSFTNRSKLPLTIMDFIHEMKEKEGQIIVTHKVQISGMLTFLFSRLIGNKIIEELPKALIALSNKAQMQKI